MSFMRLGTMTRRRFAACLVWALAGVFCCGAVSPASAQELLLTNLVLNNYEGRIRVRFGIEPTGLDRIIQALDAGERLNLRCRARLSLKRDYVWNQSVSAAAWEGELRRIKTGEYVASLPGQGSAADKDLGSLFRKHLGEILIDLGPWDRLERGVTYVLSLDLSLTRPDVSPWLKNGLFFWSFDAARPVSYQLDFTY
ncbi:MAG: hypothetical protein B193_1168 [Solidesulfovibrio magneticus str. Maddingley MBC34]|uniref:DUF4390 domain-containing protein n=1 Tax=Solidesulfovibrio magneticus str. Maddingley MBC34 TaxID=1206767 RepID=K6FNJ4_9BACT|nr:MAG: hypothetical protein B193_1168 [Solidesulfovibrio magneticus str. Maddingley MBC34]